MLLNQLLPHTSGRGHQILQTQQLLQTLDLHVQLSFTSAESDTGSNPATNDEEDRDLETPNTVIPQEWEEAKA